MPEDARVFLALDGDAEGARSQPCRREPQQGPSSQLAQVQQARTELKILFFFLRFQHSSVANRISWQANLCGGVLGLVGIGANGISEATTSVPAEPVPKLLLKFQSFFLTLHRLPVLQPEPDRALGLKSARVSGTHRNLKKSEENDVARIVPVAVAVGE